MQNGRVVKPMKHLLARTDVANLFTALGALFGVLALGYAAYDAVLEEDYPRFLLFLLVLVFALVVASLYLVKRSATKKFFDPRIFNPFSRLDIGSAWPRPELSRALEERVVKQLAEGGHSLVVVAGASGAGKTVLIETLTLPILSQQGIRLIALAPTDDIADLANRLTSLAVRGEPTVAVIDQFEQQLGAKGGSVRATDALVRLMAALPEPSVALVAVRSEWVYELRGLGDSAPGLLDIVDVSPPEARAEPTTAEAILGQFTKVLSNADEAVELVDAIRGSGIILPVELQIVGATLERAQAAGDRVTLDSFTSKIGGAGGAIELFFVHLLEGSPNRRVALKVLCALSTYSRFRRSQDVSEIMDAVFEDEVEIQSALEYLVESSIVRADDGIRYQLAHDYLAEYFDRMSASHLDPSDRDNIQFRMKSAADFPELPATIVRSRAIRKRHAKSWFARWALGVLVILMIARLIWAADWWILFPATGVVSPLRVVTTDAVTIPLIDVNYLPIFAAHLAWAWYVALYYERIFAFLNRGYIASGAVVIGMCLCVIAAMVAPSVWISSIGLGGLILGFRVWLLLPSVNEAARQRLKAFSSHTMLNSTLMFGVGALMVALTVRYDVVALEPSLWLSLCWAFSVVFTVVGTQLIRSQVSSEATSRLLGVLSRPKMR